MEYEVFFLADVKGNKHKMQDWTRAGLEEIRSFLQAEEAAGRFQPLAFVGWGI